MNFIDLIKYKNQLIKQYVLMIVHEICKIIIKIIIKATDKNRILNTNYLQL